VSRAATAPGVPLGRRRVPTPTMLQMESAECGAASLGMILAHHGRWVALDVLRGECGVSRDGVKASDLVKAARRYGLVAKGIRIEPSGLAEVRLPIVVFWNFNHFLVVEGYGPRGVAVNDPASGPRRVSWEEFDRSFTGVALTFEPGDGFERGGARPSLIRGLGRRFTNGRGTLAFCLLAGIGLLVPALFVPAATRIFVNEVLGSGQDGWLALLIAGIAIAVVAQIGLVAMQQLALLRLSVALAVTMSSRFLEHVLRLPVRFFAQRSAGHVAARIEGNDSIAMLLSSELATALLALVTSGFYLAMMFVYAWQLAVVSLLFAALNALALQLVARRQKDMSLLLAQDTGRLLGTGAIGIASIETLKATSDEGAFFTRWAGLQAKVVATTQAIGSPLAMLNSVPVLLEALSTAVIIAFGGLMVMNGDMSLGTLVAFQMLAAGFALPIGQLVGLGAEVQQAGGTLASVDDVLEHPVDEVDEVDAQLDGAGLPRRSRTDVPARLSGAIELRGVTFGYDPLGPPLIEDLDMRIEPGQRVAFIGPSGSGKSTVSQLIVGLHKPWRGEVLVDGIPRDEIPREVLAATLSFVDQDIALFEGTVRDNLTLWDPTLTDDAVARAAQDAAIHGDILVREGGFERVVEEDARDWSGGQRQRLEIARALASDPAVLVMDEATSALDPIVEQRIDQAIRGRGCTTIVVAHRLSTIRDADEIIVLDRGRVVERGTHEELLAAGGLYTELLGD